jgi:hypothetical protein
MPPKAAANVPRPEDMTREEMMAELRKSRVEFNTGERKTDLIVKVNKSRAIIVENTPARRQLQFETPIENQDPGAIEFSNIYKAIEELHKEKVYNNEERKEHHTRLLEAHMKKLAGETPPPMINPTPTTNVTIAEPGTEKKREFTSLRVRLVGSYEKPHPAPELIQFTRTFTYSTLYMSNPEFFEHFNITVRHYEHFYNYILRPDLSVDKCPDEPFIEDYRCFLGHLAALLYFNDGHPTEGKKIGGMARAFSCKLSLLTEDLATIQKGEGQDLVSNWRKHRVAQLPTKRERDATAPATSAIFKSNQTKLCLYCQQHFPQNMNTHNDRDCRRRQAPPPPYPHQRSATQMSKTDKL